MIYVDVIFNLVLPRTFTYCVPEDLNISLAPGQRVLAPFGKREITGIITRISGQSNLPKCKEIIDVLEDIPLVRGELLKLTEWLAEYYLCSWGQAVQLALPRGLEQKSERLVHLKNFPEDRNLILTERMQFLFDLIASDSGRTTTHYRKQFGTGSFYHFLATLCNKDLIQVEQRIKKPPRQKEQVFITTHKMTGDSDRILKKHPRINQILEELTGTSLLQSEFMERVGLSPGVVKRLAGQGILGIEKKAFRYEFKSRYPEEKKQILLNEEQQKVLNTIHASLDTGEFKVFLLYGITGSGKTQVYLEAIKYGIEKGRSAIVLIPEISLTPQTVQRFENFFPGQVAVFHSKMSLHERFEIWSKVYHQQVSIVVGPRSALFMPVQNLGIIVVDEEHDSSYKQNNPAPRYHARDAAIYRARMNKAVVVLGSATPSLESFYNASHDKYVLLELTKRIKDVCLPRVFVVDVRNLGRVKTESKILTPVLIEKIRERLKRREQIILLQNRRGHSAYLQCRDCGYIFLCPNCEITLTYHSHHKNLLCHYCGYTKQAPEHCPKCQGENISYIGVGTQKIQNEILKLFADTRLIRMDLDTTVRKGTHDSFLRAFKEGKADILLGTQMISKGLDFSRVTLVGVISADIGLSLPDYRASERVFQLLTQVAGRAGRDELEGEVVVQSNLSNHYAIQYASKHDYRGFYAQEIKYRQESGYPPFKRIINIRYSADTLSNTIEMAREITMKLRKVRRGRYEIVGPAPAPITKINKQYRWQALIKIDPQVDLGSKNSKKVIQQILSPYLRLKESNSKVIIDVDPLEML